jgi:hypothetical protein
MSTTVLLSEGKQTATAVLETVWTPTTHDILDKFAKKLDRTAKNAKKTKNE